MTTTGYEAYESAGALLRALSAPIRVAIVVELGEGERCVHDLVEKLAFLVGSVESARDQARARARELPEKDALARRLTAFADAMERQRVSLVSTSRGEGISGEEKLREELAMLYGNVNGYEGKPTQSQLDRKVVLAQDLDAAIARFDTAVDKELPGLNAALAKAGKPAIARLAAGEWSARK